MPKFNFFRLSVLSTTKFLFKNAIILIQKYVLKEHCTKKTYLPAIFFGVCDAPTTGCIHIAAQIQICIRPWKSHSSLSYIEQEFEVSFIQKEAHLLKFELRPQILVQLSFREFWD